ncbi:MAG TPA: polymer-forming cytoskeletal protein [Pyrinomonadaceae bacterium]|nr:polymer-forming cytoskeletal protein [Chloracidobacterium sp.]MBP9935045.1 polymer-forming cytoskeletal protein [Pyrinomonadaceae bacterium]MBK9766272.1 polymer-forming cytoskeletal protein [Chloracidobacterium sp.]MBL0241638.1 polymer-forming cytoskeletal protein [Chloracidobacterium sp.]HQX54862.1 polymer-forming cytoskeletal protein [Pyrinomonadaceae bacterium]
MIRMGRSSRTEPAESNDFQNPPAADPAFRYQTEAPAASGRAISESDAMARDIKEGRLSGFVGHGTTLTGETDFHAMLRVDGHLIGTVSSESGTLIIGTNGQVDANIMVAAAMINGTVNGDIYASEKLQLGRTARVMGNIQSPRLVVEEGAILEGSCSMMKAREIQEEEVAAAIEPSPETPTYQQTVEDDATATLFAEDDDDESADVATA